MHSIKIRIISHNQNGDVSYGITMPKRIAEQFQNCYFTIQTYYDKIILTSGTKLGDKI